jgi:hypothetical protein
MSDRQERLFRDEAGAALERVAALEDENRRLRAEVERLANSAEIRETALSCGNVPGNVPVPNGRSAVAGMVTASLAVLFASSLSLFGGRHVHHEHVHPRLHDAMNPGVALTMPPAGPAPTMPSVIEVAPRTLSECVTVDAEGHKHYKRECLDLGRNTIERSDPWSAPSNEQDPFTNRSRR